MFEMMYEKKTKSQQVNETNYVFPNQLGLWRNRPGHRLRRRIQSKDGCQLQVKSDASVWGHNCLAFCLDCWQKDVSKNIMKKSLKKEVIIKSSFGIHLFTAALHKGQVRRTVPLRLYPAMKLKHTVTRCTLTRGNLLPTCVIVLVTHFK